MKNNRSLGPDGTPVEFLKLRDDEGLEIIQDILNKCWDNEIMPDEMELAELVTLYKKGVWKTRRTADQYRYLTQSINFTPLSYKRD